MIERAKQARRRVNTSTIVLVISGFSIVFLLATSIFADYIAPYDPVALGIEELEPPSREHIFGTDQVGRDVLSRIIYGSRLSLLIAAGVISLALFIGIPVGMVAAMTGGWLEEALMRTTDLFFSFPYLILAMAIIATLGASTASLILALGIVWWPSYARLVRSMAISIKERPFIEAAYVTGNSTSSVMFRHIFPQMTEELGVRFSLDIGNVILIATGLSFLGLGTQPPVPEWGSMLGEARNYILSGWWLSFFPGIVIVLAVLSFSLFGDALQDVLRPEQSR